MVRKFRWAAVPLLTLVFVASLIPGSAGRATVSAAPVTEAQQNDITAVVTQLMGVRWNALVKEDENLLDPAYSSTASQLLNIEKVKLVKHFMIPIRTSGYKYKSYTNRVEIKSITRTGSKVQVLVRESNALTWGPEGTPEGFTSPGSSEHMLTLVQEKGRWVIQGDEYVDEFAYLKKVDHPEAQLPALREQLRTLQAMPQKKPMKIQTGASDKVEPLSTAYDRNAAVGYAVQYAEHPNPQYVYLGGYQNGGDCTNFASQVLWRGGGLYDYSGERQWWYNFNGTLKDTSDDTWSEYTWASVGSFYWMLMVNAQNREPGPKATVMEIGPEQWSQAAYDFLFRGDLIQYDDDGDDVYNHTVVVTGWDYSFNPPQPLISQHSSERLNIGWRKGAKKVRLLHITAEN
jgi:hypothetical protein